LGALFLQVGDEHSQAFRPLAVSAVWLFGCLAVWLFGCLAVSAVSAVLALPF
jgi:hypothetical protein